MLPPFKVGIQHLPLPISRNILQIFKKIQMQGLERANYLRKLYASVNYDQCWHGRLITGTPLPTLYSGI